MSIGEVAHRSRTRTEAARLFRAHSPLGAPSGQDYDVIDVERHIFAVADGVGGSPDGAMAARTACETFSEQAPSYSLGLLGALEAMPNLYAVLQRAVKATESQTTFTGGIVTNDGYIVWLQAGDSRLLHLTRYGEVYDLAPPQHNPYRRNQLFNALGGSNDHLLLQPNDYSQWMPVWGREKLTAGDRLVFATDGVGVGGFEDTRYEAEWWMRHASRGLGRTALETVNRVFDESFVIDDATLIVVDIDD